MTDVNKIKKINGKDIAVDGDIEFNINSDNAIANKTVTEFVNQTNTKIISLEKSVEIFANRTDEGTTPFATKEEVDTKIQTYIDEAILGGAL